MHFPYSTRIAMTHALLIVGFAPQRSGADAPPIMRIGAWYQTNDSLRRAMNPQ
ncbi:MAG: hypothetical protein J0H62_04540 [Rhizobiales bacterium]|nr:hypothetical protein [Hyphomicrobiales bacterium]